MRLRRKIPHSRFILFASVLRFVATSTLTTNMVGGAGSESAAGAQAADVAAETLRAGMVSGISDGSIPAEDEPKIEEEVGEKDDNEIKMKTLIDKIEALQKQVEVLTKDKSSKDVSKNKMEVKMALILEMQNARGNGAEGRRISCCGMFCFRHTWPRTIENGKKS